MNTTDLRVFFDALYGGPQVTIRGTYAQISAVVEHRRRRRRHASRMEAVDLARKLGASVHVSDRPWLEEMWCRKSPLFEILMGRPMRSDGLVSEAEVEMTQRGKHGT